MSTIKDLFQQAQLSEAAYANLWDVTSNQPITAKDDVIAALLNEGMSLAQATDFVTHWQVADHLPDTASGFSGTLFHPKGSASSFFLRRSHAASPAHQIC